MNLETLSSTIREQWVFTTWPELIAVFFGICSVLFARKNSVWLYPTGLISTGIYTWMLVQHNVMLYAEALLNAYYFVMSVYGWYYWIKGKQSEEQAVQITFANKKQLLIACLISLVGWGLLYLLLSQLTQSNVPSWDAFVSANACAGMWLLARRKVENWIWLNISNACAVPLLFLKGLPLTAMLTIFLFIVAVFGYRDWRKIVLHRYEKPKNYL